MKVNTVIFSPTGNTKKLGHILASYLGIFSEEIDLSAQDFEAPEIRDDELYIIGAPTFASRIPAIALENLKKIRGNSTKAVVFASFGNRNFDDALEELARASEDAGFKVIAGLGLNAQHSIFTDFGVGRPDEEDQEDIREFAEKILQKIEDKDESRPEIPHHKKHFIKRIVSTIRPQTDKEKCTDCKLCARLCPCKAIPMDEPWTVTDDCIACMRCISVCPEKAKSLNPLVLELGNKTMAEKLSGRKENSLFL